MVLYVKYITNIFRAWEVATSPITDTKAPMIVTALGPKRSQSFPASGPKKKVKDMQREPIHAKEKEVINAVMEFVDPVSVNVHVRDKRKQKQRSFIAPATS